MLHFQVNLAFLLNGEDSLICFYFLFSPVLLSHGCVLLRSHTESRDFLERRKIALLLLMLTPVKNEWRACEKD